MGPIYCLWLWENQWGFHFWNYVYWIQTVLNPVDEVVLEELAGKDC